MTTVCCSAAVNPDGVYPTYATLKNSDSMVRIVAQCSLDFPSQLQHIECL